MSEETAVRRDIDVPLPLDDVWPLVAGGDGWTEWLVEEADVAVEPGSAGTVVEDGERRDVRVDEVVPGERVAWTWWPAGRPADASRVELVVVPAAGAHAWCASPRRALRHPLGWRADAAWPRPGRSRWRRDRAARRAVRRARRPDPPAHHRAARPGRAADRDGARRRTSPPPARPSSSTCRRWPRPASSWASAAVARSATGRRPSSLRAAVNWLLDTGRDWDRRADRLRRTSGAR